MDAKDWFRRAIIASVMVKGYENAGLVALATHYRNEGVYYIAKGLEALALSMEKKKGTK